MSRRKRHAPHVNHERWLVSYADFITLLFAVFVVLYAAAHVDTRRMGDISHAIQNGFKDLGVFQTTNGKASATSLTILPAKNDSSEESITDTADLRKLLSNALAPEINKKQAELRDGPDGLVISLQEIGFYDQGSDILKEASIGPLNRVAAVLKPTKLRIRIEGHTDNVPIHNAHFASNWELSSSRATGLVRLFTEQYGLDPERLAAAGYAEYHPIQSNDTAEGRSQNRRVDIVVLDPPRRSTVPAIESANITNIRSSVTKPSPGH
ncbi:MAG TPA: OmpA family protein [Candidatus Angelobacter sp.]|jgi:chemotaxis protein MotB